MIKRIFNKKAASGTSHSSQQQPQHQQQLSQSSTSSQETSEPEEPIQSDLVEAKLPDEERRKSN